MGWVMSRIRYNTNSRKALEVILWCAQKRVPVDFHCALKVLFGADVTHLNRYGRPVVGDDYKALPYGPVPQTTYDIMKCDPLALSELGLNSLPFEVVDGHYIKPLRVPDMSFLSESDVEALEEGWRQYGTLSFGGRTTRSHEHPAWKKAWDAGRQQMDYADFLDPENCSAEIIDDLAETAVSLRL
jgi:uncharacterized phage-associated protein